MERTEVNCLTGEITVIQLTAGEIAAIPVPVPPTAEQNKATASSLLAGTDWTTIADVASPTNNPYSALMAEERSPDRLLSEVSTPDISPALIAAESQDNHLLVFNGGEARGGH